MVKLALEKQHAIELVEEFLNEFQNWCNQPKAPSLSDLNRCLSKNFHLTSNGQLIVKNASDYLKRVEDFRSRFSSCEISGLEEEPILSDNRIVIQYCPHCKNKKGQTTQFCMMAIATIEDNKISQWNQVVCEKGHKYP